MVEAIILALAALCAALWGHSRGKRKAREAVEKKSIKAETTRKEIEDAVNADANLVDRARRSGLLRPE